MSRALPATYRNAQTDPQDPFFLNNGLVVDAPGDNTKTEETLGRVEGTLKLFDDRWIQSAKWTASRTGVTGFENFMQASASLGTARDIHLQEQRPPRLRSRRRREAPITALVENRANNSASTASSCSGRISRPRATAIRAPPPASAANMCSTCCAPARRCRPSGRQDFNEPFQDEFTWRFSVSQQVAPIGGRLHSSIGRAVTNPSFIEQFGFLTSTFIPIRSLVPESSIGWDVGWEQMFWNGRVSRRRDLFQFAAAE